MDIGQLREGNIIVVYPRENQEGLLCVKEMQTESVICEMLSPRAGYQFRIRFHEINPVKLSADWLLKASFKPDVEKRDRWLCPSDQMSFHFSGQAGVFGDDVEREVMYVHQLQNTYSDLTGKTLHVTLN